MIQVQLLLISIRSTSSTPPIEASIWCTQHIYRIQHIIFAPIDHGTLILTINPTTAQPNSGKLSRGLQTNRPTLVIFLKSHQQLQSLFFIKNDSKYISRKKSRYISNGLHFTYDLTPYINHIYFISPAFSHNS